MNQDRYQSTSARRALALLNSPLVNVYLLYAAGDLLHFIFRDGCVVKVFWDGKFALS